MVYEILSLILVLALFMSHTYQYFKDKKREDHEWWLSECRDCIKSVESKFQSRCEEITEEAFKHFKEMIPHVRDYELKQRMLNDKISEYISKISDLKKEYIATLYIKLQEQPYRVHITTVPEHLVQEYERNISKTANTFIEFIRLMYQ